MMLLIKNFHLEMIFLKSLNRDLKAMGVGGDGTEKAFGSISKVPKNVMHVTRGRTDSSYHSI